MKPFEQYLMSSIPRALEGDAAAGGGAGAGAGGDAGAAAAAAAAGGSGGGSWYEKSDYGFDEPTKTFFKGKNYPDEKTALSSLRHADEAARNRNVIEKPDPAKPQEWKGFNEIGWVDDPKKYQIKAPQLKDGQHLDQAEFDVFSAAAHKAKLAPWQAEALYAELNDYNNKQLQDLSAQGASAREQLEQKLRGDWKLDFDANKELARRAAVHFGGGDMTMAEIEKVLEGPRALKMFHAIGAAMGEDKLVTKDGGGHGITDMTPGAARAERLRLQADENWMKVFNDARHPSHADYRAQRQRLIDVEARGTRAA